MPNVEKIQNQSVRAFLEDTYEAFKDLNEEEVGLTHIVTAVQLPTGAVEIAINTVNIVSKIEYILGAYDSGMYLKSNPEIQMLDVIII